jgi:hypothetical protein
LDEKNTPQSHINAATGKFELITIGELAEKFGRDAS